MNVPVNGRIDRRHALGAIAASAAWTASPWRVQGRAIMQRGMAGGGLVQLDDGDAEFSVVASRVSIAGQDDVIIGSVRWVDEHAGYDFASSAVTEYEVLESPDEGGELRLIRGMMQLNEDEESSLPFSLNVLDAGAPGSGRDSVALIVGEDAITDGEAPPSSDPAFSYAAAGAIIGDVQDVVFEIARE